MNKPFPFNRVFQEQNGAVESFPGFLLVNHGRDETADAKNLAWAYAQMTLQSIEFGLENLDSPEAAFPPLYLARHTLELYLKGLVTDWKTQREKDKTRHHIDYLIDRLHSQLTHHYDENEITALTRFLHQFAMIDPKSMAFRYRDGAKVSFGTAPLDDPEIWVDFVALRDSMRLIFDALDKLWRQQLEATA